MGSGFAMFPTDGPLAEDFERTEVTIDGETKPVWRSGNGPGVIIMHEVPGITPEVARFARIVRDRGFTVFLPEMFGRVPRVRTTLHSTIRERSQRRRKCASVNTECSRTPQSWLHTRSSFDYLWGAFTFQSSKG